MTSPFSDQNRDPGSPPQISPDHHDFLVGANFPTGFYQNAPVRLTDGVVFVLDDQASQTQFYQRMLTKKFQLPEDSVQVINPTKLPDQIALTGESRYETILRETIRPIVNAAASHIQGPSLVITDYEMGPITGQDVITALRSHFNDHPPFKILLNSSSSEIQKSVTGYDSFIPKPVNLTDLHSAIRELFPAGI